jgi:hypothetical protein
LESKAQSLLGKQKQDIKRVERMKEPLGKTREGKLLEGHFGVLSSSGVGRRKEFRSIEKCTYILAAKQRS